MAVDRSEDNDFDENMEIKITFMKTFLKEATVEEKKDVTFEVLEDMLNRWFANTSIEGLKCIKKKGNNDYVTMSIAESQKWLGNPKFVGKDQKRVFLFFTVITKKAFKDLAQEVGNLMKECQVTIGRKNSWDEHTTKIGFLCGPHTNFASPKWHEEFLVKENKI